MNINNNNNNNSVETQPCLHRGSNTKRSGVRTFGSKGDTLKTHAL